MTDGGIGIFYENVVKSGFIIDFCDFARLWIKIIGVLHRSRVGGLDVAQNLEIYSSYRLVVGRILWR